MGEFYVIEVGFYVKIDTHKYFYIEELKFDSKGNYFFLNNKNQTKIEINYDKDIKKFWFYVRKNKRVDLPVIFNYIFDVPIN